MESVVYSVGVEWALGGFQGGLASTASSVRGQAQLLAPSSQEEAGPFGLGREGSPEVQRLC